MGKTIFQVPLNSFLTRDCSHTSTEDSEICLRLIIIMAKRDVSAIIIDVR